MARSPPPPKWKNTDDIYDREELLIDNIFSTVKMRADLPQNLRKLIGRRILEAAIAMAGDAIEPISVGRDDARRIVQLSDKAAGSLSNLLDCLVGRKHGNRHEALAHVLRQLIIMDPSRGRRSRHELFSLHKSAQKDALTLEAALAGLRWISAAAKEKGKRIAARNKNFGVADQHVFVRVLGEGWFIATGELPTTKKSRKGEAQFFEFLHAAWQDAGHSIRGRNFKPSVDKARQSLSSPTSKGSSMTRADLITSEGPEWGLPEWLDFQTPKR